jgi:hypothetical protein
VFGSYGSGIARLSQGAWFVANYLAFEHLGFGAAVYAGSSVHGPSTGIVLYGVQIVLGAGNATVGLYTNGSSDTIADSLIENTGLSGMLLNGNGYLVTGNTILNTGLDKSNGYNNHGIYLDASNATITDNTISNFAESAISVRYRGSTIEDNTISNGQIGIDFYQTDTVAGTALWEYNTLTGTTVAGMYICPNGAGGNTKEHFVIEHNKLHIASGVELNLHPSSGGEVVQDNILG